jgi:hypothetical protein
MNKLGWAALPAGGIVILVSMAGFFHESDKSPVACSPGMMPICRAAGEPAVPADALKNSRGLLAMTGSPGYKRAGHLSLRVADCTKAEDDLESKLTAIKGDIVDMVMEGTEGSRTCTLSAVIPADRFRAFIGDLRKMGKVQSERITASKLGTGQAEKASAVEGADPRELSLVSVRLADEKVAQAVLESRGVLASSFDRGASHFMKGLAVIVELVGVALPFVLGFLALAAPVLAVNRLRRPRLPAAPKPTFQAEAGV